MASMTWLTRQTKYPKIIVDNNIAASTSYIVSVKLSAILTLPCFEQDYPSCKFPPYLGND